MREQFEAVLAELAARELARTSFAEYLPLVHGGEWIRTRMSEYLAGELQRFTEEQSPNAYDILIIETPPQHGKSMTVTETFPSWYIGRHPTHKVIIGSYNDESARRFCRRNRDKVKKYGKQLFDIELGDVSKTNEFELAGGAGRLISRGIMGGVTGNPANLILLDDPIKNRREADSETMRETLWEEWLSSFKSRLAAKAKVILIMTPWHEDDLRARIIRTEKNVRRIRLPVEAEENDPMGRKKGEPLCPELGKDAKWLREYKTSYLSDPGGGARAWSALYQCNPRIEDGNIVKREWWKYYDPKETRDFAVQVISLDAAFKDGEKNDFVAITVWGKRGNSYYLRYCLNRHLDFPKTCAAVRTVRALYPEAGAVLIEDKANGSAVIQTLQHEMFCIPVDPMGGKVSRVHAVSPAIESGHVYLPAGEPWVADYVNQWTAFPNGSHDDMVDSSTQALSYLFRMSGDTDIRREILSGEEILLDSETLYNIYN